MEHLGPVIWVGLVVLLVLGIWFPKLRGRWRGTNVRIGSLSATGFALFFAGIACAGLLPDSMGSLCLLMALTGFVLAAVGSFRDR